MLETEKETGYSAEENERNQDRTAAVDAKAFSGLDDMWELYVQSE